ncbi:MULTISPECIES: hypothetical protein [unclassified Campylobacter]|uniref:hypothetical protein n=1 Tax=unclassified Campylobacter TaxID=2593542 RepID=UPI0022EA057B|nr:MULTISPECIES: hypothetical protein [unclassified Campylobacter]MDA3055013.1 hypothetical protein [Campylobacter sp. VBCF_07 NA4]MDA3060515.1 hypothetical protein [Campylobacter sp. VBCF_02 NA5]MDA3070219.1 hypothetical protein [Campylobacter sp. VBCF_08 NA3]
MGQAGSRTQGDTTDRDSGTNEGHFTSASGRAGQMGVSSGNTMELGDATQNDGYATRPTSEKSIFQSEPIGETSTSSTMAGTQGDGNSNTSTSQNDERNGEHGLGDIQSDGVEYIQGVSNNATSSVSDERNRSEGVSLLNENGADNSVSSEIELI